VEAKNLTRRNERPPALAKAETALTDWHVQAVGSFLKANPATIDVIGFHGHTVIHRPEIRLTVQLGDGSALAKSCRLFMISAPRMWPPAGRAHLCSRYHRALAASVLSARWFS
jgi:anhydro-N-acetylmuramic acid kinase